MKRQGFHMWESKNAAHELLLWWNIVNDVVRQGTTEINQIDIHTTSSMCMCVFVFKTYCSRVAQTHYYSGTNLYRSAFCNFLFCAETKEKSNQ